MRCTILAHTPNGGFDSIGSEFVVAMPAPDNLAKLLALVSNPNLDDKLFEACFERSGLFAHVSDDHYRSLLFALGDNPRLARPYDDRWLDGWSDYSYHRVFTAAWHLTTSLPATKQWAVAFSHLKSCLAPTNFDAVAALSRWYIDDAPDNSTNPPVLQYGLYLRTRIANILKPDDALLNSSDPALRASFYRRFDPAQNPDWEKFAKGDGEVFLEAALMNSSIWKSDVDRERLSRLCWDHPDPKSNMDMPNFFNAREHIIRSDHPDWFSDAQETLTMRDILQKLTHLEERLDQQTSSTKSIWRK